MIELEDVQQRNRLLVSSGIPWLPTIEYLVLDRIIINSSIRDLIVRPPQW